MIVNKPKNQNKIIKKKNKQKTKSNPKRSVPASKKRVKNKKKINYSYFLNILLYAFVIVLSFFIIRSIYNFIMFSDFFMIKNKYVRNLRYLPEESFISIVDEYFNDNFENPDKVNIFRTNLTNLENHIIKSSDRIKKVDISLNLPSSLDFIVYERLPFLLFQNNENIYYIDRNFYIFNIFHNEPLNLIILSGLESYIENNYIVYNDTSQILDFVNNLNYEESKLISQIHFDSDYSIELFMNDLPFRVKLGSSDIVNRFNNVRDMIFKISDDNVAYIDARFSKPIISFQKR